MARIIFGYDEIHHTKRMVSFQIQNSKWSICSFLKRLKENIVTDSKDAKKQELNLYSKSTSRRDGAGISILIAIFNLKCTASIAPTHTNSHLFHKITRRAEIELIDSKNKIKSAFLIRD